MLQRRFLVIFSVVFLMALILVLPAMAGPLRGARVRAAEAQAVRTAPARAATVRATTPAVAPAARAAVVAPAPAAAARAAVVAAPPPPAPAVVNPWLRTAVPVVVCAAACSAAYDNAHDSANVRSYTTTTAAQPATAQISYTNVDISKNNIVILYTNDIHAAYEKDAQHPKCLGFSGLSAYRKQCLKETPYVTLVDCGDAVSGGTMGSVTKGESVIDMMNVTAYDFCTLGNHEADFGRDQLVKLIKKAKAKYLVSNLIYTGKGADELTKLVVPCMIVSYGSETKNKKVGLVGIMPPDVLTTSNSDTFKENGQLAYNLCNDKPETLFSCVQASVDACRKQGADYVVVLSHLGDEKVMSPFSSLDMIGKTKGIDAVLDGHSHSVIAQKMVNNSEGKPVLLTSAGSNLEAIGKLVITPEGKLSSSLVTSVSGSDPAVDIVVNDVKKK